MKFLLFGLGLIIWLLTAVVIFYGVLTPGVLSAAIDIHGFLGAVIIIVPVIMGIFVGSVFVLTSARMP